MPTSTLDGVGSGWIEGPLVTFMSNFAGQSINFTIRVWQGDNYDIATDRGSVTTMPPGLSVNVTNNDFIFYSPANDNDDSFTYTASDNSGGSADGAALTNSIQFPP